MIDATAAATEEGFLVGDDIGDFEPSDRRAISANVIASPRPSNSRPCRLLPAQGMLSAAHEHCSQAVLALTSEDASLQGYGTYERDRLRSQSQSLGRRFRSAGLLSGGRSVRDSDSCLRLVRRNAMPGAVSHLGPMPTQPGILCVARIASAPLPVGRPPPLFTLILMRYRR
jgi:hypothetical protein